MDSTQEHVLLSLAQGDGNSALHRHEKDAIAAAITELSLLRDQVRAKSKERDDAIIKYTGQADAAEQSYHRATAKVEALRLRVHDATDHVRILREAVRQAHAFAISWQPDDKSPMAYQFAKFAREMLNAMEATKAGQPE